VKKVLDIVASILVVLVSCGLIYMWYSGALGRQVAVPTRLEKAAAFPGRTIELVGLARGYSGKTIVVSLSTHCQYCLASTPFYGRLIDMLSLKGEFFGKARLVFTGPQSVAEFQAAFPNLNKPEAIYIQSSAPPAGGHATPTILLADSHLKVQQAFIGRLKPPQEEAFLDVLRGGEKVTAPLK
jgi:hypothetical protein